jgi:hypothetical protein
MVRSSLLLAAAAGLWSAAAPAAPQHFHTLAEAGRFHRQAYVDDWAQRHGAPPRIAQSFMRSSTLPPKAGSDVTPPAILGLTVSGAPVDVKNAPGAPVFAVKISDDLSGVNSISVHASSPSGVQSIGVGDVTPAFPRSGVQELQADPLSLYAQSGTWRIDSVQVCDRVFNCTSMNNAALVAAGFTATFQVINTGTQDSAPPALHSATILTPSFSLAAGGFLKLDLAVGDDVSGAEFISANVTSPSGERGEFGADFLGRPTLDGTRRINVTFDRFAEAGTWTVEELQVCDGADACTFFQGDEIDALMPGGKTFTVLNSNQDVTPPQVISGAVVTPTLNVDKNLRGGLLRLRIKDAKSGVAFVAVDVESPSGTSSSNATTSMDPVVVGVSNYNLSIGPLAQDAEAGTWKVDSILVFDEASNATSLSGSALAPVAPRTFDVVNEP